MKKIFTIILLLVACRAFSQDSLTVYNYMRNQITSNGTIFLGSWAVANIGVGIAGSEATHTGTSLHYFYQMSAIWNVANLGSAIYGYTVAYNAQNRLTSSASAGAQQRIERTFLINSGLDVVYVGIGAFIDHKGNVQNSAIKQGYGSAIIGQGAFLLLFDVTMFSFQKHNGTRLMRFIGKNKFTFDGRRVGMSINI
jgi:hypothetical protein